MQEKSAVQVERRLHALVEDPDLRAVADADDVAVDRDEVARAELADVLFSLAGKLSRCSAIKLPVVVDVALGETCALARRAAQHW